MNANGHTVAPGMNLLAVHADYCAYSLDLNDQER